MQTKYDITIIGGGILGTSIAYFLSFIFQSKKILVIEQENNVGFHTSSRNTGKVHAPYLYNPEKKKIFAKAAFLGFEMWETFARRHDLLFKKDGVIEVSLDEKGTKVLEKYYDWGIKNGLNENDISFLSGNEIKKNEPEIECENAIFCNRDGSVDYGSFTNTLMTESKKNGIEFLFKSKVKQIDKNGKGWKIKLNNEKMILTDFIINSSGGNSIDIAHEMNIGEKFTDVHFRGEYWKAPKEYHKLTKSSVYSVPDFPDYPFLDPHWIIRVDGTCEIGPNAVPIFSPYGYNKMENIKEFIPKILEMLGSGARKTIFDKQFQELALNEIQSSLSKNAMVERVRKFLPKINSEKFVQKGTAGIRSSVIDSNGKFVPDVILEFDDNSFHILNYNSPGATGALPFSIYLINMMIDKGLISNQMDNDICGEWKFSEIIEKLGI